MNEWRPDLFAYLDYRAWMRDAYDAGKAHVSAFSFRYLARRAGFSSPSFIKLVMDGQRNLSLDGAQRVAKAFDLGSEERDFFLALVAFDQAEDAQTKNEAFERVAASQHFRMARRLDFDMFEYLSRWYYPAIREMVARPDFDERPEWIAGELFPSVPVKKVEEALEVLLRLGLLERDEAGALVRGTPSLTTPHEVGSLAVGNFHRQMIERAAASIEGFPSEDRNISALTVGIKRALVPQLKERIQSFQETLLRLCDEDPQAELVYQINFQLFPLTRTGNEHDR